MFSFSAFTGDDATSPLKADATKDDFFGGGATKTDDDDGGFLTALLKGKEEELKATEVLNSPAAVPPTGGGGAGGAAAATSVEAEALAALKVNQSFSSPNAFAGNLLDRVGQIPTDYAEQLRKGQEELDRLQKQVQQAAVEQSRERAIPPITRLHEVFFAWMDHSKAVVQHVLSVVEKCGEDALPGGTISGAASTNSGGSRGYNAASSSDPNNEWFLNLPVKLDLMCFPDSIVSSQMTSRLDKLEEVKTASGDQGAYFVERLCKVRFGLLDFDEAEQRPWTPGAELMLIPEKPIERPVLPEDAEPLQADGPKLPPAVPSVLSDAVFDFEHQLSCNIATPGKSDCGSADDAAAPLLTMLEQILCRGITAVGVAQLIKKHYEHDDDVDLGSTAGGGATFRGLTSLMSSEKTPAYKAVMEALSNIAGQAMDILYHAMTTAELSVVLHNIGSGGGASAFDGSSGSSTGSNNNSKGGDAEASFSSASEAANRNIKLKRTSTPAGAIGSYSLSPTTRRRDSDDSEDDGEVGRTSARLVKLAKKFPDECIYLDSRIIMPFVRGCVASSFSSAILTAIKVLLAKEQKLLAVEMICKSVFLRSDDFSHSVLRAATMTVAEGCIFGDLNASKTSWIKPAVTLLSSCVDRCNAHITLAARKKRRHNREGGPTSSSSSSAAAVASLAQALGSAVNLDGTLLSGTVSNLDGTSRPSVGAAASSSQSDFDSAPADRESIEYVMDVINFGITQSGSSQFLKTVIDRPSGMSSRVPLPNSLKVLQKLIHMLHRLHRAYCCVSCSSSVHHPSSSGGGGGASSPDNTSTLDPSTGGAAAAQTMNGSANSEDLAASTVGGSPRRGDPCRCHALVTRVIKLINPLALVRSFKSHSSSSGGGTDNDSGSKSAADASQSSGEKSKFHEIERMLSSHDIGLLLEIVRDSLTMFAISPFGPIMAQLRSVSQFTSPSEHWCFNNLNVNPFAPAVVALNLIQFFKELVLEGVGIIYIIMSLPSAKDPDGCVLHPLLHSGALRALANCFSMCFSVVEPMLFRQRLHAHAASNSAGANYAARRRGSRSMSKSSISFADEAAASAASASDIAVPTLGHRHGSIYVAARPESAKTVGSDESNVGIVEDAAAAAASAKGVADANTAMGDELGEWRESCFEQMTDIVTAMFNMMLPFHSALGCLADLTAVQVAEPITDPESITVNKSPEECLALYVLGDLAGIPPAAFGLPPLSAPSAASVNSPTTDSAPAASAAAAYINSITGASASRRRSNVSQAAMDEAVATSGVVEGSGVSTCGAMLAFLRFQAIVGLSHYHYVTNVPSSGGGGGNNSHFLQSGAFSPSTTDDLHSHHEAANPNERLDSDPEALKSLRKRVTWLFAIISRLSSVSGTEVKMRLIRAGLLETLCVCTDPNSSVVIEHPKAGLAWAEASSDSQGLRQLLSTLSSSLQIDKATVDDCAALISFQQSGEKELLTATMQEYLRAHAAFGAESAVYHASIDNSQPALKQLTQHLAKLGAIAHHSSSSSAGGGGGGPSFKSSSPLKVGGVVSSHSKFAYFDSGVAPPVVYTLMCTSMLMRSFKYYFTTAHLSAAGWLAESSSGSVSACERNVAVLASVLANSLRRTATSASTPVVRRLGVVQCVRELARKLTALAEQTKSDQNFTDVPEEELIDEEDQQQQQQVALEPSDLSVARSPRYSPASPAAGDSSPNPVTSAFHPEVHAANLLQRAERKVQTILRKQGILSPKGFALDTLAGGALLSSLASHATSAVSAIQTQVQEQQPQGSLLRRRSSLALGAHNTFLAAVVAASTTSTVNYGYATATFVAIASILRLPFQSLVLLKTNPSVCESGHFPTFLPVSFSSPNTWGARVVIQEHLVLDSALALAQVLSLPCQAALKHQEDKDKPPSAEDENKHGEHSASSHGVGGPHPSFSFGTPSPQAGAGSANGSHGTSPHESPGKGESLAPSPPNNILTRRKSHWGLLAQAVQKEKETHAQPSPQALEKIANAQLAAQQSGGFLLCVLSSTVESPPDAINLARVGSNHEYFDEVRLTIASDEAAIFAVQQAAKGYRQQQQQEDRHHAGAHHGSGGRGTGGGAQGGGGGQQHGSGSRARGGKGVEQVLSRAEMRLCVTQYALLLERRKAKLKMEQELLDLESGAEIGHHGSSPPHHHFRRDESELMMPGQFQQYFETFVAANRMETLFSQEQSGRQAITASEESAWMMIVLPTSSSFTGSFFPGRGMSNVGRDWSCFDNQQHQGLPNIPYASTRKSSSAVGVPMMASSMRQPAGVVLGEQQQVEWLPLDAMASVEDMEYSMRNSINVEQNAEWQTFELKEERGRDRIFLMEALARVPTSDYQSHHQPHGVSRRVGLVKEVDQDAEFKRVLREKRETERRVTALKESQEHIFSVWRSDVEKSENKARIAIESDAGSSFTTVTAAIKAELDGIAARALLVSVEALRMLERNERGSISNTELESRAVHAEALKKKLSDRPVFIHYSWAPGGGGTPSSSPMIPAPPSSGCAPGGARPRSRPASAAADRSNSGTTDAAEHHHHRPATAVSSSPSNVGVDETVLEDTLCAHAMIRALKRPTTSGSSSPTAGGGDDSNLRPTTAPAEVGTGKPSETALDLDMEGISDLMSGLTSRSLLDPELQRALRVQPVEYSSSSKSLTMMASSTEKQQQQQQNAGGDATTTQKSKEEQHGDDDDVLLSPTRSFLVLDMSRHFLGDVGAAHLAETLRANQERLVAINISNNGLTDAGAIALLDALRGNPTLFEANFSGNKKISSKVGKHFAKFVTETPNLRRLNLDGTQVFRATLFIIQQTLDERESNVVHAVIKSKNKESTTTS